MISVCWIFSHHVGLDLLRRHTLRENRRKLVLSADVGFGHLRLRTLLQQVSIWSYFSGGVDYELLLPPRNLQNHDADPLINSKKM
ncbi:hypothetical protein ACFX15_020409 [Malus domestica]